MRSPRIWLPVLLAAGLLIFLAAPRSFAEEEPEAGEEAAEAEDGIARLTDEEAKPLEKELTRAAKRRKFQEVIPVLDEVGERWHPCFQKPLLKMLTHESTRVALRAAEMLSWQKPENAKDAKKLGKAIWKKSFTDRKNHKRYTVQGAGALAAAAVEGGVPLDNNRFKDVERLWRTVVGDPREANAPAIISVCEYVRLTEDKRLCRQLAEEIDEPGATAVNSPTNPPAAWWERRWKMWKQYKADVVETLEDLTEQSFKDTASAKAWFKENEKEFGFRW